MPSSIDDQGRHVSDPEPPGDDARQPVVESDGFPENWLRQITAGRIDETVEEIASALKGHPEISGAALLRDMGIHFWDQKNMPASIALFRGALELATEPSQIAGIAGNLGKAYEATQQYEDARVSFERAATLYEALGDTEWHLWMLLSIGNALDGLERDVEAVACYRKTAELAAATGYPAQQAFATSNLGNLFGTRANFKEARVAHAEALRIAWAAGEVDLVRKTAHSLAGDLRLLGDSGAAEGETLARDAGRAQRNRDYALALAGINAASVVVDEQKAPLLLADIWDTAGQLFSGSSNFDAAIDATRKAIALADRESDQVRQAAYCLNLSSIYIGAGRHTDALNAANVALTVAKQSNESATLVKAIGNLGIIKQQLGDFAGAELDLRRQYQLSREMEDEPQTAQAANSLGAFYLALGASNLHAAEFFNEAQRLAQTHCLVRLEISSLNNLAIVEGRRTKPDRNFEEAMYRRAIELSIKIDSADTHVDAAINLVRLLAGSDRIDEAITVLKPIEGIIRALNDTDRRGALYMLEAELALKQEDFETAREAYQAAGANLRETSPERSAQCIIEATHIEYDQYVMQKAAGDIKKSPEAEAAFLRGLLGALVQPIATYMRIAQKLDEQRLWALMQRQESGFRLYAELVLKSANPSSALEAFESGRGRSLRLSMYRRQAGQRTSMFDSMQALRAAMFESMTGLNGEGENFEQLTPEAFAMLSRSVQRKEPEVPPLVERDFFAIAKSLDAPLVEFALGARGDLHVWVVSDGAIQFKTLDLTTLGGVDGIRKTVAQLRVKGGLTRDLGVELATPVGDATPVLRQLFDVLVRPIEMWLPERIGAPVCIVPDGPLFDVPFAALQASDGRAVLDRWSVFEVPALHFFAAPPERPGVGVLVAGDPKASTDAEDAWGPIDPLRFAREEAEEVARIYGTSALVEASASRTAIEHRLGEVEVAHLAAHAILLPAQPFDSAIVLAGMGDDDGLMRMRDIDRKKLRARLAVLSCCSTGGGVVTGDGVLSLCRSLLAAGAHTVVASLWAVADESTRFTMVDFHRRLVKDPFRETLAQAFRQSQLATRAKYPHHSQWAPFVLWGWPQWVQGATWTAPVLGKTPDLMV